MCAVCDQSDRCDCMRDQHTVGSHWMETAVGIVYAHPGLSPPAAFLFSADTDHVIPIIVKTRALCAVTQCRVCGQN